MIVWINGNEVDVFAGARVSDALMQAFPRELDGVILKAKRVVDGWGNPVDLDGELSGGEKLRVVSTEGNE